MALAYFIPFFLFFLFPFLFPFLFLFLFLFLFPFLFPFLFLFFLKNVGSGRGRGRFLCVLNGLLDRPSSISAWPPCSHEGYDDSLLQPEQPAQRESVSSGDTIARFPDSWGFYIAADGIAYGAEATARLL